MLAYERFGSSFPVVCSVCHHAELEFLRYPRSGEDHMYRHMTISRTCKRCNNTMFKWPNEVDARVCLPTGLIADATSFAQKHQASLAWGIKPSCADLQLTNLECAARDDFRRRAYLTVGHAAVVDELVFTGYTFGRRVAAKVLPTFCGLCREPTAWRAWDTPAAPRVAQRFYIGDSSGDGDSGSRGVRPELNGGRARDDDGGREGAVPPGGDNENGFMFPGEARATVCPAEPSAADALAEANAATAVEEQQRAYVEGGVLHSTTTAAPGDRPELVEPPGLEGGEASGNRTAVARFPQLTESANYLHSNNPKNLQLAHDLRNIGIGYHNPYVSEAKTRDLFEDGLKEKVFTAKRAKAAMRDFETTRRSALPKKLTHQAAYEAEIRAMNAALTADGVGYDTVVEAFVKSDVSAKDRPRPIANHKETRLFALAKVAYVYEHILFDVFRSGSIKGRGKHTAIGEIVGNMSKMRKGARFVENDLTSFEFGISEPLKQIEQRIFQHIARLIGVEDSGQLLFDRVVNDRDKCATWRMTFKDSTGEKKSIKIVLGQTMRESGDRVTSSGNFLQNLIAWFSYLVDPEHVDDALDTLIKFRGARMFYVSPRCRETVTDRNGAQVRRKFMACMAFEGDDTAARFEEKIWSDEGPCPVAEFFTRWGWKAKLVWKPLEGDTYLRFVGYEVLLCDSDVVYDGGNIVMTPEVKRLIKTKSWSATDVTPQELKTCIRIFAATLAEGFKHVEPMHAFLQALYDDNAGGVDVCAEKVREYVLAVSGHLPDADMKVSRAVPMPGFECGDPSKWKRLLRVSAGDFTDREWADMCHIGTVRMHGADLATCVPASWRA
ncbi:RNA-dependent RNA polymerase [Beihai weivirus-like virus 17]|uniref:RNA-dependent RNA polymerase n=1 Tax=Beihai weivirus-like virus 17 TaxID=1922745 RepID=UPI0009099134|nr:RNA-dependent RNA polymerase [Beihai weivirus-like virus 17]APG78087.1 RNA-dependent RNA polymerase [Beihai weivirus-like virus 17]